MVGRKDKSKHWDLWAFLDHVLIHPLVCSLKWSQSLMLSDKFYFICSRNFLKLYCLAFGYVIVSRFVFVTGTHLWVSFPKQSEVVKVTSCTGTQYMRTIGQDWTTVLWLFTHKHASRKFLNYYSWPLFIRSILSLWLQCPVRIYGSIWAKNMFLQLRSYANCIFFLLFAAFFLEYVSWQISQNKTLLNNYGLQFYIWCISLKVL